MYAQFVYLNDGNTLSLFLFALYTIIYFTINHKYGVQQCQSHLSPLIWQCVFVREQERLMAYSALFFLLLVRQQWGTTQQPADGSDVPDLQKVSAIPYCAIDDFTIENYETGL